MASTAASAHAHVSNEYSSSASPDAHLSAVAYLKVTMRVLSLSGAAVLPGDYTFRWVGAAKGKARARLSPVRTLPRGGGLCPVTLAVYVKARRDHRTNAIVPASSDPADSLLTTLFLHRAGSTEFPSTSTSLEDNALISQLSIDMSQVLADSHAARSFDLPGGFCLDVSVNAKSMGDTTILGLPSSRHNSSDTSDHLIIDASPSTPPSPQPSPHLVSSHDPLDTAAKLEQLRKEVNYKSDQIDSLKQKTAHIDQVLQDKVTYRSPAQHASSAPSVATPPDLALTDFPQGASSTSSLPSRPANTMHGIDSVPEMHTGDSSSTPDRVSLLSRVQVLEAERATLDREKAEAERKIQAHVQHAAKIKTTYNQLATWYNNLRHEHAELQARSSESSSNLSTRDNSVGNLSSGQEDIKKLREEKEELRQMLEHERREKENAVSQNVTDMEAHNLAVNDLELRLQQKSQSLDNAELNITKARSEIDELRAKVEEASALFSLQTQLEQERQQHKEELQRLQVAADADKAAALEDARVSAESRETMKDTELYALREALDAAALKEAEDDEKHRRLSSELDLLRAKADARAQDLESSEKDKEEHARAKEEIERLRQDLSVSQQDLKTATVEAEQKERQMDDMQRVADELRVELDASVEELERERRNRDTSATTTSKTDTLVDDLTAERDRAILELFRVRKSLNAELRALRKERDEILQSRAENDSNSSELSRLQNELETAAKEKESLMSEIGDKSQAMESQTNRHASEIAEIREAVDMEKTVLSSRVADLENELKNTRDANDAKLRDLTQNLGHVQSELHYAKSSTSNHTDRISLLEKELEDALAAKDALSRDFDLLESRKDQELKQINAEIEELRNVLSDSVEVRNNKDTELAALRTALESARADNLAAETVRDAKIVEMAALSAELSSLKESMEESSKTSNSAELQLANIQKALAEKRAEHEALLSEFTLLESSKEEATAYLSAKENELADQSARLEEMTMSLKTMEGKYESAHRALSDESHAKAELDNELSRVVAALYAAENTRDELGTEISTIQASLANAEALYTNSQGEVETLNSQLEQLKSALDAIVHDKDAALTVKDQDISKLQEELAVSTRCLAEKSAEFEKGYVRLQALETETLTLKKSLESANALAQKYENMCHARMSIDEANEALREEIKSLRESSAEKEDEFVSITALLKELNAAHAESAAECDVLHGQNKELKREVEFLNSAEARKRTLENDALDERKRLREQLASSHAFADKVLSEKQSLISEIDQSRSNLMRLESERTKLEEELRESRGLQARSGILEREISTLKSENHELSARMDAMNKIEEGKTSELVGELIQCKLNLAHAWEQIDGLKRQIKQLNPDLHVSPNVSGGKGSSSGHGIDRLAR